jgi:DHA3 family tetracycline resistance protein-like MFS transporter
MRAGRGSVTRAAILRPLAIRDFALLWLGQSVSLIGDGLYFVAIAWQVYDLDNSPGALSVVGAAWMAPQVAFLLLGGVLADRYARRNVLIAADLIRLVALAMLAALALSDALELWHAIVLVALYGCGEAMFGPAFGAIVPELVPPQLLVQANALDQLVKPLALRLAGPAIGGVIVATAGAGAAFAIDAASFAVSAVALALLRTRARPASARSGAQQVVAELREGLAFVRSQRWLWATLLAAALTLLFSWGPKEVLVPYLVKNDMQGGAEAYGLLLAAGGVGAVLASAWVGTRGLPRRHVLFMYVAWTIGPALVGLVALTDRVAVAMAAYLGASACLAAGLVVWTTLMQRHVPGPLLGRVSSLDWFVSVSLVPLSFLLVGPVSAAAGADTTLLLGSLLAAVCTLGFLALPGLREIERQPLAVEEPADPEPERAQPLPDSLTPP